MDTLLRKWAKKNERNPKQVLQLVVFVPWRGCSILVFCVLDSRNAPFLLHRRSWERDVFCFYYHSVYIRSIKWCIVILLMFGSVFLCAGFMLHLTFPSHSVLAGFSRCLKIEGNNVGVCVYDFSVWLFFILCSAHTLMGNALDCLRLGFLIKLFNSCCFLFSIFWWTYLNY